MVDADHQALARKRPMAQPAARGSGAGILSTVLSYAQASGSDG
jgi:hypothetical protein